MKFFFLSFFFILFFGCTPKMGTVQNELQETLGAKTSQFEKCYKDELLRTKKSYNTTAVLLFTINPEGNVINTDVTSGSDEIIFTPEAKECMTSILKSLKFSKPANNNQVRIQQPILLEKH